MHAQAEHDRSWSSSCAWRRSSRPSASSPPGSPTRSTRRPVRRRHRAASSRGLRRPDGAAARAGRRQPRGRRRPRPRGAARARPRGRGPRRPRLPARARPRAFERATDGVERVGVHRGRHARVRPPADERAAARSTSTTRCATRSIVAANEYKYIADVTTDFGDLPPVICNGGDINQVFLNLIVNAAHAIEDPSATPASAARSASAPALDGDHVRHQHHRHGPRHPARRRRAHLRPLLHHQGRRARHRPGPRHRPTIVVERHGGTLSFETEHAAAPRSTSASRWPACSPPTEPELAAA